MVTFFWMVLLYGSDDIFHFSLDVTRRLPDCCAMIVHRQDSDMSPRIVILRLLGIDNYSSTFSNPTLI